MVFCFNFNNQNLAIQAQPALPPVLYASQLHQLVCTLLRDRPVVPDLQGLPLTTTPLVNPAASQRTHRCLRAAWLGFMMTLQSPAAAVQRL